MFGLEAIEKRKVAGIVPAVSYHVWVRTTCKDEDCWTRVKARSKTRINDRSGEPTEPVQKSRDFELKAIVMRE